MKIAHLLFGLVLFFMIIAGSVVTIGELNAAYPGANMSGTWNNTYNKIDTVSDTSNMMYRNVSNSTVKDTAIVWLPSAVWKTMMLSVKSAWITKDIAQNIEQDLGLPNWFMEGVITLIVLAVVFAIAAAIFRRNV